MTTIATKTNNGVGGSPILLTDDETAAATGGLQVGGPGGCAYPIFPDPSPLPRQRASDAPVPPGGRMP